MLQSTLVSGHVVRPVAFWICTLIRVVELDRIRTQFRIDSLCFSSSIQILRDTTVSEQIDKEEFPSNEKYYNFSLRKKW